MNEKCKGTKQENQLNEDSFISLDNIKRYYLKNGSNCKIFQDYQKLSQRSLKTYDIFNELKLTNAVTFSYYELPQHYYDLNESFRKIKNLQNLIQNISSFGELRVNQNTDAKLMKRKEKRVMSNLFKDLESFNERNQKNERKNITLKIKANDHFYLSRHLNMVQGHIENFGTEFDYGKFYQKHSSDIQILPEPEITDANALREKFNQILNNIYA